MAKIRPVKDVKKVMTAVFLPVEDKILLQKYGNNSVSRGIRALIESVREEVKAINETREKESPIKLTNRAKKKKKA